MSDPSGDYDDLFEAALKARAAFDELAEIIRRCGRLLAGMTEWTYQADPVRAPASLAFRAEWPEAKRIEEMIAAWHEAGRRLRVAYEALPPPAQRARRKPEDAKIPRVRPA